MKQPEDFVESNYLDHVSSLRAYCILYHRKQSFRMLKQTIDDYMRKMSGSSSAR